MAENDKTAEKDITQRIRDIIEQVMTVEEVVLESDLATVEARGELTVASEEAFDQLQDNLEELDHTPVMYSEIDGDVVLAVENEVMVPTRTWWWLSLILLLATVVRLGQLGIGQEASGPLVGVMGYLRNWTLALPYAGVLLATLVARELARALVALRYEQKISFPFFLPLPGVLGLLIVLFSVLGPLGQFGAVLLFAFFQMGWGTIGSFATLRTPVRDRRVPFDMAVAATLAGLAVSIPAVVIGLAGSQVVTRAEILQMFPPGTFIFQEGNSLAYYGIKFAVFGQFLPAPDGTDVLISTLANAGWAGLILTMFNLLPIGSLDGGHIVYGLFGEDAVWGRVVVLVGIPFLWLLSIVRPIQLFYPAWIVWLVFVFIFLRNPAQVLDEITKLGPVRTYVGVLMLVLFVLLFAPVASRPLFAIPDILPGA